MFFLNKVNTDRQTDRRTDRQMDRDKQVHTLQFFRLVFPLLAQQKLHLHRLLHVRETPAMMVVLQLNGERERKREEREKE